MHKVWSNSFQTSYERSHYKQGYEASCAPQTTSFRDCEVGYDTFFCCALRSSVPKPNHIAAQMLNAAMCEIRAWDNITVFCLCCLSIRSHWVQPPMALWVHSVDGEHDPLVYASTLCFDILLFPAQRVHCCYCCWDLAVFLYSVCFFVSLSLYFPLLCSYCPGSNGAQPTQVIGAGGIVC